jgi:hypothetical protein
LLVHDVINYGVPICAFYSNVTPRHQTTRRELSDGIGIKTVILESEKRRILSYAFLEEIKGSL